MIIRVVHTMAVLLPALVGAIDTSLEDFVYINVADFC